MKLRQIVKFGQIVLHFSKVLSEVLQEIKKNLKKLQYHLQPKKLHRLFLGGQRGYFTTGATLAATYAHSYK